MTKTVTVSEFVTKVEQAAAGSPNTLRFVRTMKVGEGHVRQGDIYIWRIEAVPEGCTERKSNQLAEGASIGQRHMIGAKAKLYDLPQKLRHELLGPVFVLTEREIGTHPEHAHYSLPSGVYQVGYQLNEQTRRRVQD